jgi:hypothetical protein
LQKLLETVAAFTHFIGREPTDVSDTEVIWFLPSEEFPEGNLDEQPMLVVRGEPVEVTAVLDDLAYGYMGSSMLRSAIVGYCHLNNIKLHISEKVWKAVG